MKKYISILCAVLLLTMWNCTMEIFVSASDDVSLNESIGLDVDINSFESSYTYAKTLFNNEFMKFSELKDWILSEKCQAYYKTGPYPKEVRKSLYWAETKKQWKDNSMQYRSEVVFEDFNVLFSTYQICDILALNKNYEINLYENPATIVSFHVLSQEYDYEESLEPPLLGFQEKLVIIDYTGTETYESANENDFVEALGNGWYLIMRGYDEHITSIMGDVNNNRSFGVSDVVLLQRWLLGVPDTHLNKWKAADYNHDNRLDVFDLCLMKRALIENNQTNTE